MPDCTFKVQGSAADPYVIEVTLSPFSISCSCPAGAFMPICKHRLQIVQGKDPGIVDGIEALEKVAKAGEKAGVKEAAGAYEVSKAEKARLEKKAANFFKGYVETRACREIGELKTDRSVAKVRDDFDKAAEELVAAAAALFKTEKILAQFFIINGK